MHDRRGGLYLSWRLGDTDADSARETLERLTLGEKLHLYKLCSWVVAGNEVKALLTPAATLDEIAAAIWKTPPDIESGAFRMRWVSGQRGRVEVTREIEISPVVLGLARRPEEWPYSSAAAD